ncbi:15054_t:CDS:2, partial [Cetraspora pellucida]
SSDNNTIPDISSSSLENSTFTSNQQFSNKKYTIDRYCLCPLNNPEVKAFFKFFYPLVKLPSQKDLKAAQKDTNDVTLVYNSWKNIKKESIFGSILITSMGKVLIWNAEDISDECTRTCAALKNLATKIEEGNDEDLNDFPEILLTYISNNE